MTLYDDIPQQPRVRTTQAHIGDITSNGLAQRSARAIDERGSADRPNEQSEIARSMGNPGWRDVIAAWAVAALLAFALLAVPTSNAPHSNHSVSPRIAPVPHQGGAGRPRIVDGDDPVPCSDLDYAYERC